MPWMETRVDEQMVAFVTDCERGEWPMTELCRSYGISRKTGYKMLKRFAEEGVSGLLNRSRAPHSHPNETDPDVQDVIVRAARLYPNWGAHKVLNYLEREFGGFPRIARSTAEGILLRNGLVLPRKKRRRATPTARPLSHAIAPNVVWSADFKGWFRTGDRRKCFPLTVTDNFSRYLLGCVGLRITTCDAVQPVFIDVFREYGLPDAIRTDNGAPFATIGFSGLSRLAAWWIKLGIKPERIEPGRPDQNGRHERFHKTLKQATACPPSATLRKQQNAFDSFQVEYNEERSHDALDDATPAQMYQRSPRPYPEKLPPMEYPGHFEVCRVYENRQFTWRCHDYLLARAFVGENVGLEQCSDRLWSVYFGPLIIGVIDQYSSKIMPYRKPAISGASEDEQDEEDQ